MHPSFGRLSDDSMLCSVHSYLSDNLGAEGDLTLKKIEMIAIWLYIPLVTIRKVYLLECDYVKFVSTSVNFNLCVNQLGWG